VIVGFSPKFAYLKRSALHPDGNMPRSSILVIIAITSGSICGASADCPVPLERFGKHPQPPTPPSPR
jgi:hypothetical protein